MIEESLSGKMLAMEHGVGTSTILDIKKNSDSNLKFVSLLDDEEVLTSRKTITKAQNNLETALYKWFIK